VTLFANQIRNPVWVNSLSRACLELVAHPFTGVLHVAGRQVMSRADFGLKLLEYWGVQERDTLRIGVADGRQWPLNCELDIGLATAVLNTRLSGVHEVLRAAAKHP
jgi:dTDP-4-dehydrorhamnose reductase